MSATPASIDERHMRRALELAARGEGAVEPNPQVGCVLAHGEEVVGEGWHARFGGPHAERVALDAAGARARGATLYVTLEPCCHFGKTPPCTQAVISAGIARVVVAQRDPYPEVAGEGLRELQAAGIVVQLGLLTAEAESLNGPYRKRILRGRPWILAKWAMTLDGKMATRTGHSQWISSPASRHFVHQVRGRMDAILIGARTAEADNPLLTARPPGPRTPLRIVLDSQATLSLQSQLVQTIGDAPLLVAVGPEAERQRCRALEAAGCELFASVARDPARRLEELLDELGRRRLTNVLVEGGARVFGTLLEIQEIDEVLAFIAPKLIGGESALSPIGGLGIGNMAQAIRLEQTRVERFEEDICVRACVGWPVRRPAMGKLPDGDA
jgi:diaminohydroxyphosphoribosylaminopyrimidine deaminase/5-amino-6-(5-phosphoribosylamino)uracil reductase